MPEKRYYKIDPIALAEAWSRLNEIDSLRTSIDDILEKTPNDKLKGELLPVWNSLSEKIASVDNFVNQI